MSKLLVLYPEYFDSELSRSKGRRVPRHLASPGVGLEEVIEALKGLGLTFEVHEGAYPRNWWEKRGFVIVEAEERKEDLLRRIAERIKERRKSKIHA